MAKFCMNCGAKLTAEDAFCPSCGKPVAAKGARAQQSQAAAPASGARPQAAPQMQAAPRMQAPQSPVAPQPRVAPQPQGAPVVTSAASGPNWTAIVAIVAIAVVAAFGIYLYHDSSTSQPASSYESVAKKPSDAQAKQNDAQEKEKKNQAAYLKTAAQQLEQGEKDLATLANRINSGQYGKNDLMQSEQTVAQNISNRKNTVGQMPHLADANAATVIDLFDIQQKRAECMAKGVMGDTNQYAVGGKYYDAFQEKFAAFKKANHL